MVSQRPQVKLFTSAEMNARQEKGVCYNCDEKFVLGHKCKHRLFMMMNDGELYYARLVSLDDKVKCGINGNREFDVSLNAISGSDGIATMRFKGVVGASL